MAVFFQKIPLNQFNYDEDFVVAESKGMRIMIGLFFLVFTAGMSLIAKWIAGIMLAGTILYLLRIRKNTVIMTINKNGFYYYGQLLTTWENFRDVQFIDEPAVIGRRSTGLSDRFYLMLRYYKPGEPGHFGRKIPLTNIQNKSEEEIIAAIRFYYITSKGEDTQ